MAKRPIAQFNKSKEIKVFNATTKESTTVKVESSLKQETASKAYKTTKRGTNFQDKSISKTKTSYQNTLRDRGTRNTSAKNTSAKSAHNRHAKNKNENLAIGTASRAAAAFIVEDVRAGVSLNDSISKHCKDFQLDERDISFVKEIVYGTLRNRRILMTTLQPMFNTKLTDKDRIIMSLLLTAFYQLVYMRSPAHAVVSATVSACGACGRKSFTSVANAILRKFLREGATLAENDSLAVTFSFPDWLYQKLEQAYGKQILTNTNLDNEQHNITKAHDVLVSILRNSNEKAPLFLRIENSKISTQEYLAQLEAKGIEAQNCSNELALGAVMLKHAINVEEIPGFNQGLCTVQDLSAQMAVALLELNSEQYAITKADASTQSKQNQYTLKPCLRVLDCCCAPGGKTAHILDLNDQCELIALDVDEERLELTKRTLKRLGRLDKVTLKALDAQDLSSLPSEFDRILVDAPCSGTGVIRRHPDIKWLRRSKDIDLLVETQSKILDAAFAKLKNNGILVYTTCSILPQENDEQVQAFLARHTNAKLLDFSIANKHYSTLQSLPQSQQGDGFFYARFVKNV